MHPLGHYGMALVAYSPIGTVTLALGFDVLALLGGLAAVGTTRLPDLDGRVSFVTHRGPTHTIWFALAVGVVFGIGGALLGARESLALARTFGAFAALIGIVSIVAHLFADALNPAGVRPFAPVRDTRYSLEVTGAAHPLANQLLLAAGVSSMVAAVIIGRAIGKM